jgi:hypothetical protein
LFLHVFTIEYVIRLKVEAAGIEPVPVYSGKIDGSTQGAAESGAIDARSDAYDPDPATLLEAWPAFPGAVRRRVVDLVREASDGAKLSWPPSASAIC